jgi:hypothetical protein
MWPPFTGGLEDQPPFDAVKAAPADASCAALIATTAVRRRRTHRDHRRRPPVKPT